MGDLTFSLVGKRILSFELLVHTAALNDFSLGFIKRKVTLASCVQSAYFGTTSPRIGSVMLLVHCYSDSAQRGSHHPAPLPLGSFTIYLLWVWLCDLLWPLWHNLKSACVLGPNPLLLPLQPHHYPHVMKPGQACWIMGDMQPYCLHHPNQQPANFQKQSHLAGWQLTAGR